MWKVGGIKIESAAGRKNFYQSEIENREKWKFFTLRPPAQKRREILRWAIKDHFEKRPSTGLNFLEQ